MVDKNKPTKDAVMNIEIKYALEKETGIILAAHATCNVNTETNVYSLIQAAMSLVQQVKKYTNQSNQEVLAEVKDVINGGNLIPMEEVDPKTTKFNQSNMHIAIVTNGDDITANIESRPHSEDDVSNVVIDSIFALGTIIGALSDNLQSMIEGVKDNSNAKLDQILTLIDSAIKDLELGSENEN